MAKDKLEKINRAYDSPNWWYDLRGFFILTLSYQTSIWQQILFFAQNIKARHLEVAIGTGTLLSLTLLWRRLKGMPTVSITAIDYSERMLEGAKKRFKDKSYVRLSREDVGQMSYSDSAFDSVNIANSVHCFPDIQKAFKEIHRVLVPGGTLAFNVLLHPKPGALLSSLANKINVWGIQKGILERAYTESEVLIALEKQGFEVREKQVRGNSLNILATRA